MAKLPLLERERSGILGEGGGGVCATGEAGGGEARFQSMEAVLENDVLKC